MSNLTQYRCTNPGYIIDGVMMQEFALLGMKSFKGIILFLKHILTMGWSNHKKYYNSCVKNNNLTKNAKKRGVKICDRVSRQGKSAATEYRHLTDIDKNIEQHAKEMHIHQNTLKQRWVSYHHNRNNSFWQQNESLNKSKQKEFDQLQQQLWKEYHNNPERITNLTLNIVNRRQSYRDIQDSRVAVCYKYTKKFCICKILVHVFVVIAHL